MENQAKKRKDGAEKLRDKKTPHSLDKVLPIEKRQFILHKAQISTKKNLALGVEVSN